MRWLRVPVAGGLAAGALAWLLGVVAPDAVLIGFLAATVVAGPAWVGRPEPVDWEPRIDRDETGGWYEVRRMVSMLRQAGDQQEVFDTKLRPRLRRVAESRLARLGVGWGDDRARRLLGPDVHDLLSHRSPARPVGLAARWGVRSPLAVTELILGRLEEMPDALTDGRRGTR